jgi:transcriptional regulator
MSDTNQELDRLINALAEIERAAADNVERSLVVQQRARHLRAALAAGEPLVELVRGEESPRVVELLSTNMSTLETAGAELRAAQALALREEGLTIESIADLFGVTRQRISALLRQKAAIEPGVD